MKKNLLELILMGLLLIFFLALPADALGYVPQPPEGAIEELDPQGLIETIGNWLFWIILALAVIFILLAAFTFLTSGGDPEKVNKAKGQLIYALVAVVVAVLAWGLVELVRAIVAGSAVPDPENGVDANNEVVPPPPEL